MKRRRAPLDGHWRHARNWRKRMRRLYRDTQRTLNGARRSLATLPPRVA